MTPCNFTKTDKLFYLAFSAYFIFSVISIVLVGLAFFWFMTSSKPILDWHDPNGPGFRVLEITKESITVQWVELRKVLNCPGKTELAIIGRHRFVPLETYPIIVESQRMTFNRKYDLPSGLPTGLYHLKITDTVKCNPLFDNVQVFRVPFEVKE